MEENLMCPICGGLHPAGHRDKELEEKLEAINTAMHKIVDPLKEQKKPLNTSQYVIYAVVGELLKILEAKG